MQHDKVSYTLGLGEANLAGKSSLCYDDVCKTDEIHTLGKTEPYDHIDNYENQTVYVTPQIRVVDPRFAPVAQENQMDPADFLMLKNQLSIKSAGETAEFCFRSKELVEITKMCKDLRRKVPGILEVEVDPQGRPRIQEAAMRLYVDKRGGWEKDQLLQGMQGIEAP